MYEENFNIRPLYSLAGLVIRKLLHPDNSLEVHGHAHMCGVFMSACVMCCIICIHVYFLQMQMVHYYIGNIFIKI